MKSLRGTSVLTAIRNRLDCWYARQGLATELEQLAPGEADRIMHDIGISMSDMAAISKPHAGPRVLLPQRLEAVGLDPAYLAMDPLYRDMERTCMRCTSWRKCARDLAANDAQSGLDHYCLNAQTIDALLTNRPDVVL